MFTIKWNADIIQDDEKVGVYDGEVEFTNALLIQKASKVMGKQLFQCVVKAMQEWEAKETTKGDTNEVPVIEDPLTGKEIPIVEIADIGGKSV